ncbi:GNAT family N-acetyltransferase [Fructilactobacillus sanfranciscensis]|uniref:GNAT family N-acetyltransferase n=1 Tax=Fructilactobacillus sanfranciscensis TaxID=1625 RepID=UPI00111B0014|nr:GNAT family N-acetyltransferase [Fructilactobacillus sanfranciscensis]MCG7195387.1 GNAT family N-acetyltransferase [Fructilactobacillus sanfranciscensis]TNL01411.1 spermidine acetyltransferase [Fructilactobacillus sanfranciscensis]
MLNEQVNLLPLSKDTEDENLVRNLFLQPSTLRYWFRPPFANEDELTQFIDTHIKADDVVSMTINVTESGMAERQIKVGLVEVIDIDQIARVGEIEITMLDKQQGHGYAQIAFQQMIDHMFQIYNMHKLYLYVDVENAAAVHIYKKLGFETEGTIKDQFYAMGSYHDAYYMGLTRTNYDK